MRSVHVSNHEVKLTHNDELVSITDTRGIITYANADFIRISGFSEQELISHNHNLVRHPDMPKAAFKDLWDKLKQGQSWRGIVKNRCKDGKFYWVDAFVSPLYEGGKITGYQSVRIKAQDKDIANAQSLYNKVNQNQLPQEPLSLQSRSFIAISLIILLMGLLSTTAPWYITFSAIFIIAVITSLFKQELVDIPKMIEKYRHEYDSVSRVVFCGRGAKSVLEFQRLMNQAKMRGVLGRASDQGNRLSDISSQLVATSLTAQQSTEDQQHQVHQMASAIEELHATVAEMANHATQTFHQVADAQSVCVESRSAMQQSAKNVETLSSSVTQAATNAHVLQEEAEKVSAAMSDINGIAEQTNLLALNAAIEAARAGEQGRGFAVVADEVRALSSRTQLSTDLISKSVQSMHSMLNGWSKDMQTSKDQADDCVNQLNQTMAQFDNLYQGISQINEFAQQSATAAEQQKVATQELASLSTAVNDISISNIEQMNVITSAAQHVQLEAKKAKGLSSTFG